MPGWWASGPYNADAVSDLHRLRRRIKRARYGLSNLELLEPEDPGARAEQQVLRSLSGRLQRALDRELQGLSLQELLFDLRSWQESLSNDGGVMLG